MALEGEMEADNESLVAAALKGDGPLIEKLSKSLHDNRLHVEALFETLASLTDEHDRLDREFTDRFDSLNSEGSWG